MGKQVMVEDEGDFLVLKHHGDVEYEIAFDRCKTHGEILAWVHQLSQKTWMTTDATTLFIELASEKHGLMMPWEFGI